MSLHIYCPTSRALVLCALKDDKGVLHIPIKSNELPGIEFGVQAGEPINPQIIHNLESAFEAKDLAARLDIEQSISLEMTLNNGEKCTTYLCHFTGTASPQFREHPKLVDLLRAFPANSNRKELLKAFQYFSGGLSNDVRALAPEDFL